MSLRLGILNHLRSLLRRSKGPFPRVGNGTYVDPTAQFLGASQIEIGEHSSIGEDCWFNINQRDGKVGIQIGNSCFIGRRNFLTSGSLIRIGDYALTGPDCQFLGANHASADPLTPYVLGESPREEPILIGENCWFGSAVIVLRALTIGHGSIIGAGSVVTKNIPPFSIVMGNPARVTKRFDFSSRTWISIAEWTEEKEHLLPDASRYLEMIRSNHPKVRVPTIAAGGGLGNL